VHCLIPLSCAHASLAAGTGDCNEWPGQCRRPVWRLNLLCPYDVPLRRALVRSWNSSDRARSSSSRTVEVFIHNPGQKVALYPAALGPWQDFATAPAVPAPAYVDTPVRNYPGAHSYSLNPLCTLGRVNGDVLFQTPKAISILDMILIIIVYYANKVIKAQ